MECIKPKFNIEIFLPKNIHNTIFFISLILIVITLPFSMLANNAAIALLILNWLIEGNFKQKWQKLKHNRLALLFTGFYFLHVFGLIYTQNLFAGKFDLEIKSSIFIFPVILSTTTALSKKQFRIILKAFVFSCLAGTVICLVYAVHRNYEEGRVFTDTLTHIYKSIFSDDYIPGKRTFFNYWYFSYNFFSSAIHIQPVYFAMYLVFSGFIAAWLWLNSRSEGKKSYPVLTVLFLIYCLIVIILLSSRMQVMAFIGILCFAILYYAYYKKTLIKGLLIIMGILILGISIVYIHPVTRKRFLVIIDEKADNTTNTWSGRTLRFNKWKYTLEVIAKHPILGVGTGDAQDELQKTYFENNFELGYNKRYNPHNQYLHYALKLGVLGFLLFIACLLVPARFAFRQHNYLYLSFLALFALSCLTESMLERNKGIVFYAFFNSLFAFHYLTNTNQSESRKA